MSAGTRFPVRPDDQLSPEELEATQFGRTVLAMNPPPHDHLISSSGNLLGHFNTLIYRPVLVKPLFEVISKAYALPVPANTREVALFALSAFSHSPYQAYVHSFTAKHNGSTFTDEQLAALERGERPSDLKPEESIAWDVVKELYAGEKLTDATFNKAVELLGKDETLNLIFYVSLSAFTALLGKGADVGLPYEQK
ncbi:hypothetical protein DL546_002987 [Coniochaeta pulveracea]|uniref:Carboxymuconolactone decarboxylase-like domain-containing protein n=1 Tax=Coniochaeta pulveracea TaxID=177199 RepID=A0A420Y0B8_9PEZI|nr:hypothetical protein DL546_002987 [Coniochaeta pulveracea]